MAGLSHPTLAAETKPRTSASEETEMRMLWPALGDYADWALLALRLMVAIVFFWSGWSHATHPVERGKSIGMGPGFTRFLGIAEICGALGVAFGVLIQAAAIGLMLVNLGAIQKKIFVWKTGFWGEKASGWHYDLLFIVMNLVIATTGGGRFVLL
jgi:putative oxidoreductase